MRYQKTEWGVAVTNFAHRYGMSLKEIAKASGVSYSTFLQVRIGKTPGEESMLVKKVEAFMKDYAAKTAPKVRAAVVPLEEEGKHAVN